MDQYDFIVIGAGVTGLAGAMYSARLGMKTLVLGKSHGSEMPIGGVITTTNVVENYPGFGSISGTELAEKIEKQAREYEDVEIRKEKVVEVKKEKSGFLVKTEKKEYLGKTVLFATGTKVKRLPETVVGGREYENRGVAYCALCDGVLYKGKIVAVIGGSDSAIKDAMVLAEHAKKVYIIYRGEKVRAEPVNLKSVERNEKIEIVNNTNVTEIFGKGVVEGVVLDKAYKGKKELNVSGVFVAIGHEVLSELASEMGVKVNENKEIIINHKTSETNIPGVYAAGDVTDKGFKQAITGVADGCTAAYSAFEYQKIID